MTLDVYTSLSMKRWIMYCLASRFGDQRWKRGSENHWVNQDRVYTVYRPCNRFTGCTRPYKIDSSCKRLQGL